MDSKTSTIFTYFSDFPSSMRMNSYGILESKGFPLCIMLNIKRCAK